MKSLKPIDYLFGIIFIAMMVGAFLIPSAHHEGGSGGHGAAAEQKAEGGEAAHPVPAGHGSEKPVFDWRGWLFSTANFSLLIYILMRILIPIMRDYFGKRSREIDEKFKEAEELLWKANNLIGDYEKKLAQLETEKESEIERYNAEAERERKQIIEQAKERIEKMKKDVETSMETKIKQAKARMKEEIAAAVVEEAEAIIRKELGKADNDRLIDNAITQIKQIASK